MSEWIRNTSEYVILAANGHNTYKKTSNQIMENKQN